MKEAKVKVVERKMIAVIDTETNWNNEMMSIGIVLSKEDDFRVSITSLIRSGGYADYSLMFCGSET